MYCSPEEQKALKKLPILERCALIDKWRNSKKWKYMRDCDDLARKENLKHRAPKKWCPTNNDVLG